MARHRHRLCRPRPLRRCRRQGGAERRPGRRPAASVARRPVGLALAGVGVGLVIWHQPFVPDDRIRRGEETAAGPSALVVSGRFYPQWLRVPVDGCVVLCNDDGAWGSGLATGGAVYGAANPATGE